MIDVETETTVTGSEDRAGHCRCGLAIQQQLRGFMWLPMECPTCTEEGNARVAVRVAERATRNATESAQRRLAASGLPPAYRTRSRFLPAGFIHETGAAVMLEDLASPMQRTTESIPTDVDSSTQKAIRGCEALRRGELPTGKRGLYLYGTAGGFKTTVAASTLAAAILEGRSGLYVTWQDLIDEVLASYREGEDSKRSVIARYAEAATLVIDDIAKDRGTLSEHSALVLFQLMDARYQRDLVSGVEGRRWLILTSNRTVGQLCSSVADETVREPLARRLSELLFAVNMDPAQVKGLAA